MKQMDTAGLTVQDFRRLLKVPDKEVIGEVIRLNCTLYSNSLDVIKVCTRIKTQKRSVL